MRNAGLEEAQDGIKIAGRNVNNLRCANDTTLTAESEELKSLLMKVKEDQWRNNSRKNEGMEPKQKQYPCKIPVNLENSEVATGLEKVNFHSNPKERQCQRMFRLLHNCTHLTC